MFSIIFLCFTEFMSCFFFGVCNSIVCIHVNYTTNNQLRKLFIIEALTLSHDPELSQCSAGIRQP